MTVVWSGSDSFLRDSGSQQLVGTPLGYVFGPGTYEITLDIDQATPGSRGYSSQVNLTWGTGSNGSTAVRFSGLSFGEHGFYVVSMEVGAVDIGGGYYDVNLTVITNDGTVISPAGKIPIGGTVYLYGGGANEHHGNPNQTLVTWSIDDGITPPPPPPDPPGGVIIDDDGFTPVAELTATDIEDMKVRIELQGTGSGLAQINRHNDLADEDNIKKGNWLAFVIAQIQDDPIFLTQIETLTTTVISTDEEGGEVIRIAGRGALSYMERAKEMPSSYVVPAGEDYDGVKYGPASTGNEVGMILERTLAEFQHANRGVAEFGRRLQPLAHLTHDFDYVNDSAGNAWDVTPQTAELSAGQVGQTGLTSCLNLIGTNAIDIQVWPNMVMQAFNSYGRDLTGASFGPGVVRFVKGVNIAERLDRQFAAPVDPTDTIVQGNPGKWAYASHPLAGTVPDVEGFVRTFGDDLAALEQIGIADMARRIRQGESVQFRVTVPRFGTDPDEDAGLYLPGPPDDRPTTHTYSNGHYWVGDTVTLSTGTGFHDFEDVNARIMAITIEIDEAGDLDVTVELKATTIVGRFPTTGTPGSGAFGSGSSPAPGGTGGSTAAPPIGLSDGAIHDHIVDTTDAHDASAISLLDAAGHYDAANVEAALAEGPPFVIVKVANKSGGSLANGDVVIVDTANNTAVTTTTTGRSETSVGVVQETIANNATGRVLVSGYAALVNVPASVTRGHYVETHTVAKQATGSATRRSGSFGQFLTGGTSPTAILWGQTDQTASGGGGVTVQDEGTPLSTTADTLNFTGGGVVASGSGTTKTINVPGITADPAWAGKGDLIVGTGNDAASILTAGTNDQIPMYDSSQSTGMKTVGSQTPSTQAFGDSAAEGTADTYSRGDHKHGMPTGSQVMVAYPLNSQALDGTYGDDFDESALNARWTGHNLTSSEWTTQQGPRASALAIAFPATTAARYIYQTDPNNTNETWEVNFTLWQRVATGNMFGLLSVDTNGDGIAVCFYDNTAGLYLMNLTNHVEVSINASHTPYSFGEYRAGQQIWLKLVKAGTTFTGYGSTDGECYVPVGPSGTSSTTKARVGVGRFLGTTANSHMLIHRFNKTA